MGNPKYKNGFKFTIHEDALDLPLKWRNPRKIFVNSMSDLFHESMKDAFLERCFDVMVKANWHIFQVLTKRPERMLDFVKQYGNIPDHIWLGTSVELDLYKSRIEVLRKAGCKTRFVSFEPLLGPVGEVNLAGISWAIVGGESGPNYREIKADWIREIQKQCEEQGVAFFFKQWGGVRAKSGGRLLDGKEWNEYPRENRNKKVSLFATSR
jgi:protein gp37